MTKRISFRTIMGLVAMLGLGGSAAQAAVISVNLRISEDHIITSEQTAGAPGVHVDNWNNVGSSAASNLIDSDGNGTTADYSLVNSGDYGYGGGWYSSFPNAGDSGDRRLLSQFRETTGEKILRVSIAEIPYEAYDLYVYFGGPGNRAGSVTANGTTIHFITADTSLTYAQATSTDSENPSEITNYAVFSGLTSESVFFDLLNTGGANVGFAGFQIVPVPEPTAMALMALGGLSLLARRRSNG